MADTDKIQPINVGDLRRLGIGPDNELFWDERRVEVRRRLTLTGLQKVVAVVVTMCAILGGLGGFATGVQNASVFLCARGNQSLGCPVPRGP